MIGKQKTSLPSRAAKRVAVEGRIWVSFFHWASRDSKQTMADNAFTYQRKIRPILKGALWLVGIEGVIVDAMLLAILGNSVWVWIVLGLHLYAMMWIAGFIGSLRDFPHVVEADRIILRDSVFHEVVVPMSAIRSVRRMHEPVRQRTGYQFDPANRTALMAYGVANLKIVLDTDRSEIAVIKVSVDEPDRFVAAVQAAMSV